MIMRVVCNFTALENDLLVLTFLFQPKSENSQKKTQVSNDKHFLELKTKLYKFRVTYFIDIYCLKKINLIQKCNTW